MLPLWLHLKLLVLFQVIAFYGGGQLGISLCRELALSQSLDPDHVLVSGLCFVAAILGSLGCILTVRSFFENLLPVRCARCSGKAYCCDHLPVSYQCSRCGHLHQTDLYVGSHEP